jgi:limonene-1,2-epoxide hydrolase
MNGVDIATVRDGKVAAHRDYFDMAAMMSQLGLMPGT